MERNQDQEPVSYTHLDVYKRQAQTMDEVRKAMRIDYFSDAAYIEEQAAKYRI